MKTLIRQYKSELKQKAKDIRAMKDKRKGAENGYVSGLFQARYDFRVKHVAYCLMRGRTLEQIEGPHPGIKTVNCGRAWKEVERLMVGTRMYIIVRQDLSKSQQIVQACHAVSKFFTGRIPEDRMKTWNHTKVVLGVDDAKELIEYYREFAWNKGGLTLFRESDLGHSPTAFSVLLQGDEGEILKRLDLL